MCERVDYYSDEEYQSALCDYARWEQEAAEEEYAKEMAAEIEYERTLQLQLEEQAEDIAKEERKRLEREEMAKHYERHPHG